MTLTADQPVTISGPSWEPPDADPLANVRDVLDGLPPRPALNAELLAATLAHVLAQPETWTQIAWRSTPDDRQTCGWNPPHICGTAYCFGGWAVALTGARWIRGRYAEAPRTVVEHLAAEPGDPPHQIVTVEPFDSPRYAPGYGLPTVHPSYRAQRLLGLTNTQAAHLFGAGNTLPDLVEICAQLLASDGAWEPDL